MNGKEKGGHQPIGRVHLGDKEAIAALLPGRSGWAGIAMAPRVKAMGRRY